MVWGRTESLEPLGSVKFTRPQLNRERMGMDKKPKAPRAQIHRKGVGTDRKPKAPGVGKVYEALIK